MLPLSFTLDHILLYLYQLYKNTTTKTIPFHIKKEKKNL